MSVNPENKKSWQEKYGTSIRMLLPFRWGKDRNQTALQDENIGCFSYMSLHWMNGHMWKASRNQLDINQIKDIRRRNGVEDNTQKLKFMWDEEIRSKSVENASLFRVMYKFNALRLIFATVVIISMAICNYVGPTWVLHKMLQCLDDPEISISEGVSWAAVFSLTQLCRHMLFNYFWILSAYAGIKITAALQGFIYEKIIAAKTTGDINMAELVSFYTVDLERIFQLMQFISISIPPPIIIVMHLVFCYTLIGPWTLVGNIVTLLYIPFMLLVIKMAGNYRSKAAKMSDKRIGFINQLLNNIKFVKMMTWENVFFEQVKVAREGEKKSFEKAAFLQSLSTSAVVITGSLSLAITIIGYVLTGGVLKTVDVLNLMSAYAAMATPLGTVVMSVKAISEGLISSRRIQKFLSIDRDNAPATNNSNANENPITINNMKVSWRNQENTKKEIETRKNDISKPKSLRNDNKNTGIVNLGFQSDELYEQQLVLDDINLIVQRGQLVGICGSVGSGKSTLLSSICRSTNILSGEININGTTALVTQQAWIFTATVKQNILFGLPFDSEWYNQVIEACCLQTDFQMMVNGDETEIGERGGNLSGGQKQRINLARALYSNSDIHLLDDPLSAVDAKVAKHIFENCIQKHLRNKTVLFVTHAIQFLTKCDFIVVLQNGKIREKGTHEALIANGEEYAQIAQETKLKDEMQDKKTENPATQSNEATDDNANHDVKMIKAEVENKSTISLKTLLYFCKQCGGYFVSFLLLLSIVLFAAISVFNNLWFKIWLTSDQHVTVNTTKNYTTNTTIQLLIDKNEPQFYPYFAVYVSSVVGIIMLALIKGALLKKSILTGSTRLHMQMFWKVVRSPMTFFDSTPVGRIVNRFSRDMDELDVHIPSIGEYVGQTLFIVTFQAAIVCYLYPWFTIALVAIIAIFIVFDKLFTFAVQKTKRADNLLKPPVINHLITTAQGIDVIRCYKRQQLFTEMFTNVVEKHLSPYLLYQLSSKWISFRVDIIGWVAITVLAVMVMLTKSTMSIINGGLSLVLIIQACIILSVAMRFKSELEAKLTSVERICDYSIDLPQEAPAVIKDNRPPPQWPSSGNIEFKNVYLKYRPKTSLVLKGLNVTIKCGDKVGIIGRTGAGKSSILVALLRLTEVHSGNILIDNVDISKIGLNDLRTKLAVIPQDPVLFDGTVRWNLDPNQKYTDEEIWEALEKSYLKSKIVKESNGLHTLFNADGGLFSVGEKQLFCLARALLIKSKILLLDEATANVDFETDKLIQKSIRNSFVNCTVLTIAHRLNTIIDYDKVMVMEAGQVIEYDTPQHLLATESKFRSMLNAQ